MITSKQRAYLRSMANTMDPILFIGKEGVTEATAKEAYDALEARELIKGTVQQNCDLSAKEALEASVREWFTPSPCSASAVASCSTAGAVSPRSNCRDGNKTHKRRETEQTRSGSLPLCGSCGLPLRFMSRTSIRP